VASSDDDGAGRPRTAERSRGTMGEAFGEVLQWGFKGCLKENKQNNKTTTNT